LYNGWFLQVDFYLQLSCDIWLRYIVFQSSCTWGECWQILLLISLGNFELIFQVLY
jgi:hypothetical protein